MMVGSLLVPGRGKTINRFASIVAGLSLAFVGTSTTIAGTINVPSDQPTIAAAIAASHDGDLIKIAPGIYNEHSLNPGGKAITIQGTLNGDESLATTIDAQQNGRVFEITSGETSATVIQSLIMTGGQQPPLSADGGGIYCDNSSPTITGCTIKGNTADFGGGISCDNSNPTISGCTISGNTADIYGGGIYCFISNPTINGGTVCGNTPTQIDGPYTAGQPEPVIAPTCPPATGACCLGGTCVTTTQSDCAAAGGTYGSDDMACADANCATTTPGDVDGDGDVDTDDLSSLRSTLALCASDVDSDGDTDIEDLLSVISGYGGTTCP